LASATGVPPAHEQHLPPKLRAQFSRVFSISSAHFLPTQFGQPLQRPPTAQPSTLSIKTSIALKVQWPWWSSKFMAGWVSKHHLQLDHSFTLTHQVAGKNNYLQCSPLHFTQGLS
jgi:hypothetical protein